MFLKLESPYPWGVKRFDDLEQWQIQYMMYCKRVESEEDWNKKRWELDYVGSYTNAERAIDSMKEIENRMKSKNGEAQVEIRADEYFDPTPPMNKLTPEKQLEFDEVMRMKFGEKTVDEKFDPDDFDSIEAS